MRALLLGRFNPPHNGHVKAIEYVLNQKDIDEIIILVGSGEKAYSTKNPFTGGERVEMLKEIIMHHFDYNKFYLMAIPDANRNTIWPAHVIDLVPSFDVIYTNNPLVKELFNNLTTKEVRPLPLFEREKYSSSKIRKMMMEGKPWENLVPSIILPLIKKYNGVKRIQALTQSDEKS